VSGKLKAEDQPKARRIGLLLAMLFRIILLFGITWVLSLQDTLFSIDWGFFEAHVTGQSLIIFGGGLFLLYKSVSEIHHKLEGEEEGTSGKASNSLSQAIIQIALLNIVFSFDSILTAVGMVSMKEPSEGGFGYEGALLIMILSQLHCVFTIVPVKIFNLLLVTTAALINERFEKTEKRFNPTFY
jgi:predicted tellurium resistance membrane protein TerC